MLDRFELLVGKDSISKLESSSVLILGLGGVGSYVVEGLVRSGVSNFILVDFDKIELTNLNRQVFTNCDNIGNLKVSEVKKRILSINPLCNVITINSFIDSSNIDELFSYDIDFFVDACDSINTKKLVIDRCISKNIDFITCMGTGNRLNPFLLKIVDIRDTSYDPVARIIRKHVKDMKYKNKIKCMCSSEIPLKRGNLIGSSAYVPSCAGLMIASYVIERLINRE